MFHLAIKSDIGYLTFLQSSDEFGKKFSKFVKGFFKPNHMEVAVSCVCSSVTEPSERCCGRVYRAPSVFPSLEVKLS